MKLFFAIGLAVISLSNLLQAQCPTASRAGVHIMQPGESLYRLSKNENVPLGELLALNGLKLDDIVPMCREIYLNAAAKNEAPTSYSVMPEMADRPAAMADKTTFPKTSYPKTQSSTTTQPTYQNAQYSGENSGFHVVSAGETIAQIADMYGYTERRFRAFNNLPPDLYDVIPGSVLKSTDCSCFNKAGELTVSQDAYMTTALPNTNMQPGNANNTMQPDSEPQAAQANDNSGGTTTMSSYELEMVAEINLMRGNPAGYVTYVEEYIKKQQAQGKNSSVSAARELISELRNLAALPLLEPSECIYQATKLHGEDQRLTGDVDHTGTDGSYPWDRIARTCEGKMAFGENIVGGTADIRRAIMLLLVDDGITSRGHRVTLLNPEYKSIACYHIGTVGGLPNCWIQGFAD